MKIKLKTTGNTTRRILFSYSLGRMWLDILTLKSIFISSDLLLPEHMHIVLQDHLFTLKYFT